LAGIVFALSGKLLAHTAAGHTSMMAAVAWLPWALGFLHRLLGCRKPIYSALLGIAMAAQIATHSYVFVFTAYGLLAYTVLYLALTPGTMKERWRSALPMVLPLLLAPLIALLLGAIQLLPTLEMIPHSNRALDPSEATRFSISPAQTLTGILFPSHIVGHEAIVYPGLMTMALAAGSWWARRDRPVLIMVMLTVTGILLAMGRYTPLYELAYRLLPGLGWLRTPGRLWFFIGLGLAILAAFGFEAWHKVWRLPSRRTTRLALVACSGASILLSLGAILFLDLGGRGVWGLGVFGASIGILLLWAIQSRPSPTFFWIALVLLAADLLSFGFGLIQYLPQRDVEAAGSSAAQWLAGQDDPLRVYSPSYSLPQPAVSEAGLQQIDGVEGVHLGDYDRFMAMAGGYGDDSFTPIVPPFPDGGILGEAHRETRPDLGLLGMLNGKYLATAFPMDLPGLVLRWREEGTWIYENEKWLPRAFIVHQTEVMPRDEMWNRLETLDPGRLALVEVGPHLSGTEQFTPAQVTFHSPNHLTVETQLDAPGLLVVSEIWYPGWKALDNGHETDMVRTNAIFRGVPLETGHHVVELQYRPWTVVTGAATSAVTALVLAFILATFALRRWLS
jgi:hypothetical protein